MHSRGWCWVDILQDISQALNQTKTRSHGLTPMMASKMNNEKLFKLKYKNPLSKKTEYTFKKNDFVRIRIPKVAYYRGFKPSSLVEVYQVTDRYSTNPHIYRLKTAITPKIALEKGYYSPEMVRVTHFNPEASLPREPLKSRKRNI